jgi:hypothetical protein
MIRGLGQYTTVVQDGVTVQIPPGDVGGAGTPYYGTSETISFPSDSGTPAVAAGGGAGGGGVPGGAPGGAGGRGLPSRQRKANTAQRAAAATINP